VNGHDLIARAEVTTLVVVAVEAYAAGATWDLPGPAADARRFADWFWSRGVPPERTWAFISALDGDTSWQDAAIRPEAATRERIRTALVRRLGATDGDLLVVVWGGHGTLAVGGHRHLFTADATAADPVNIDVDGMLELHRSPALASFPQQLWLVDACQTLHDGARSRINVPREDFGVRDGVPGKQQEVLFAASPGQRAANLAPERTGLFSREVLAELHATGDAWPPDVPALGRHLTGRFSALRADGLAQQTPTYLWVRDRSGLEGQLLASDRAAPPPSAPVVAPPARLDLAPMVDALLAITEFGGVGFRDEVLSLLRREIGGSVPRSTRARAEAVSLLSTCRRFPGGLPELREAVRLCAGDTPQVLAFCAAIDGSG
jgi:hypothetical protein